MSERPDLAGRVAWTYLATLAAAVVGGLIAVVAFQVVNPMACTALSDELAEQALNCSLLWGMGLWVLGFAAAFAGALLLLKVEAWLGAWLAMVAGLTGLLVGVGQIGQWWWWAALVLLPAIAALASAPWRRDPRSRTVQLAVLAVVALAAVATFGWQIATA